MSDLWGPKTEALLRETTQGGMPSRPDDPGAAQLLQHAGRDSGRVEGRHDQHIGGVFQTAERIGRHELLVERDIGAHLAVIFELHTLGIENSDGPLHALSALSGRMAEVGEGEHRDTRLVAQPPRHSCRFDRDVREIFGRRHFGDRRVGEVSIPRQSRGL